MSRFHRSKNFVYMCSCNIRTRRDYKKINLRGTAVTSSSQLPTPRGRVKDKKNRMQDKHTNVREACRPDLSSQSEVITMTNRTVSVPGCCVFNMLTRRNVRLYMRWSQWQTGLYRGSWSLCFQHANKAQCKTLYEVITMTNRTVLVPDRCVFNMLTRRNIRLYMRWSQWRTGLYRGSWSLCFQHANKAQCKTLYEVITMTNRTVSVPDRCVFNMLTRRNIRLYMRWSQWQTGLYRGSWSLCFQHANKAQCKTLYEVITMTNRTVSVPDRCVFNMLTRRNVRLYMRWSQWQTGLYWFLIVVFSTC